MRLPSCSLGGADTGAGGWREPAREALAGTTAHYIPRSPRRRGGTRLHQKAWWTGAAWRVLTRACLADLWCECLEVPPRLMSVETR